MSSPTGSLSWLSKELGLTTLYHAGRDVHLLLLSRVIRMFAYGSSTLVLAIYFDALGHSRTKIGLFMTLTLIGDVFVSLLLTLFADRLGRRRILVLGALLMTFSGVVFANTSNYWILLLAAIVGVISPSGNEIGPFRAVEESTIAHLVDAEFRADVFALSVVGGTLGASLGSLTCGWLTESLQAHGWTSVESFRMVFWLYAAVGLVKALMSLCLTTKCELQRDSEHHSDSSEEASPAQNGPNQESEPFLGDDGEEEPAQSRKPQQKSWTGLSKASTYILLQLCGLFFFDSLASGMVPASLVSYFISDKFHVPEGPLGTIMAVAQFISSLGNIFASSVARRIGLIPTMVFTHLPSAIFLALIPLPSSLALTVVLLVARSSLNSMDQAPRSAFLAAVVLPEERTKVMGIVNTVKTMSQSAGPLITGTLAGNGHFGVAFVTAGALKASYDLAMLKVFSSTRLEGDRDKRRDDDEAANVDDEIDSQHEDAHAERTRTQ